MATAVSSAGSSSSSASRLVANVMLDALPQAMQGAGITPSSGTTSALDALRSDLNGNQQSAAGQLDDSSGGAGGTGSGASPTGANGGAGAQGTQGGSGAQGSQKPQGGQGSQTSILQMLEEILKTFLELVKQLEKAQKGQGQGQGTGAGSGPVNAAQANPAAGTIAANLPSDPASSTGTDATGTGTGTDPSSTGGYAAPAATTTTPPATDDAAKSDGDKISDALNSASAA